MSDLIALYGPAGAGKTTAANWLIDERGYHRVKFAGPLKAMLKAIGLTEADLEGTFKERPSALLGGRTPRFAMQTLGTEWGRDLISPTIWIDAWKFKVQTMLESGFSVVCDDLRFPNEMDAVLELGGRLVKVTRPTAEAVEAHSSEEQPLSGGLELVNDRSLVEFYSSLATVL
jgi:hypothetical protein